MATAFYRYKNEDPGKYLHSTEANPDDPSFKGLLASADIEFDPSYQFNREPTKKPVNVLSSDPAQEYISGLQSYAERNRSLIQSQLANLQTQSQARRNQIQATFAEREKQLGQQQEEQTATAKTLGFRLGRDATPYQFAEDVKLGEIQSSQRAQLAQQREDLMNQVDQALFEGNARLASFLIEQDKNLAEQEFTMRKQQAAEQAAQSKQALDEYYREKDEMRKQGEFESKQSEQVIKNLAPSLFSNLSDDPTKNNELIRSISEQYKIDPLALTSSLLTYKSDREKEQVLNSSNLTQILARTEKGGSVDVPGLGKVEVLGKEKDAPTTLKAGGKVYQWNGTSYIDTGIKDTELTPSVIINALQALSNPTALQFYLEDQGVSVPGSGSVSFRHNNPLNIKFGDFATQFGATPGSKATDGGQFALFPSVEAGERAAKALLTSSSYANLPLEQAMRRWSGNGYGADVAPELKDKKTGEMSESELSTLMQKMKQREGWVEGSTSGTGDAKEIAKNIFNGLSTIDVKSLPTKQRADVDKELTALKQEALKSGDFMGVMRASAGGQSVGDTFLTSFDKALNVIQQVSDLQRTIETENTGPILGIIRSKNPYDEKAQLIKSQLAAIVPNLARGVYGEVGVLTDNDIANYTKTLPNLQSTEAIRDAILGITVRSVQRSLENKLRTQANGGKDVSGFVETYQGVKNLADSLLKNIEGGTAGTIKVRLKSSGQTGSIPANEFDPNLYDRQ